MADGRTVANADSAVTQFNSLLCQLAAITMADRSIVMVPVVLDCEQNYRLISISFISST